MLGDVALGPESGFRVLSGGAPGGGDGPRIVVYRLDPATLNIVEISGAALSLFGYDAEAWRRPGAWLERLHPEDRAEALAFYAAWRRQPRGHELRYRLVGADGRAHWVHDIVEVWPGPDGDEIRGVLVDITERIERDAELRHARRLRHELLRIVAEELGRPVRILSAYGGMLSRHLAAQRDEVGGDFAVGISDGIQRLDTLVARLLRIAQGGHMTVEEITESLAAIRQAPADDT